MSTNGSTVVRWWNGGMSDPVLCCPNRRTGIIKKKKKKKKQEEHLRPWPWAPLRAAREGEEERGRERKRAAASEGVQVQAQRNASPNGRQVHNNDILTEISACESMAELSGRGAGVHWLQVCRDGRRAVVAPFRGPKCRAGVRAGTLATARVCGSRNGRLVPCLDSRYKLGTRPFRLCCVAGWLALCSGCSMLLACLLACLLSCLPALRSRPAI
ncbi:uncharacterized protein IWZ02DRAFT_453609 [Phyllosticta citriasiana]|uniref:uncharacterized protein n=1 Tax=Phyllosticta citriasiana TaxID=595635 RepID=UPI0030FD50DB